MACREALFLISENGMRCMAFGQIQPVSLRRPLKFTSLLQRFIAAGAVEHLSSIPRPAAIVDVASCRCSCARARRLRWVLPRAEALRLCGLRRLPPTPLSQSSPSPMPPSGGQTVILFGAVSTIEVRSAPYPPPPPPPPQFYPYQWQCLPSLPPAPIATRDGRRAALPAPLPSPATASSLPIASQPA